MLCLAVADGSVFARQSCPGASPVELETPWRAQKLFSQLTPITLGPVTIWTWRLPEHFPRGKFLRVRVDGGTLHQLRGPLVWNRHGFYEVSLDAGVLILTP